MNTDKSVHTITRWENNLLFIKLLKKEYNGNYSQIFKLPQMFLNKFSRRFRRRCSKNPNLFSCCITLSEDSRSFSILDLIPPKLSVIYPHGESNGIIKNIKLVSTKNPWTIIPNL